MALLTASDFGGAPLLKVRVSPHPPPGVGQHEPWIKSRYSMATDSSTALRGTRIKTRGASTKMKA